MNRKQMIKMLDELKGTLAHMTLTGALEDANAYAGKLLATLIQEALEKQWVERAPWLDIEITNPSEAGLAAAMLSAMLRGGTDESSEDVR